MVIYHALGIQSPCENGNGTKKNTLHFVSVIVHPFIILWRTVSQDPLGMAQSIKQKSSNQKKHIHITIWLVNLPHPPNIPHPLRNKGLTGFHKAPS